MLLHLGTLDCCLCLLLEGHCGVGEGVFPPHRLRVLPGETEADEATAPQRAADPDDHWATLPLFVILPIKDKVEGLYGNTIFVGCALAVTGCILFFSDRMARGKEGAQVCHHAGCSAGGRGPGGGGGARPLPVGGPPSRRDDAGFHRRFAVRFSFLLSIPAVLGPIF